MSASTARSALSGASTAATAAGKGASIFKNAAAASKLTAASRGLGVASGVAGAVASLSAPGDTAEQWGGAAGSVVASFCSLAAPTGALAAGSACEGAVQGFVLDLRDIGQRNFAPRATARDAGAFGRDGQKLIDFFTGKSLDGNVVHDASAALSTYGAVMAAARVTVEGVVRPSTYIEALGLADDPAAQKKAAAFDRGWVAGLTLGASEWIPLLTKPPAGYIAPQCDAIPGGGTDSSHAWFPCQRYMKEDAPSCKGVAGCEDAYMRACTRRVGKCYYPNRSAGLLAAAKYDKAAQSAIASAGSKTPRELAAHAAIYSSTTTAEGAALIAARALQSQLIAARAAAEAAKVEHALDQRADGTAALTRAFNAWCTTAPKARACQGRRPTTRSGMIAGLFDTGANGAGVIELVNWYAPA